MTVFPGTCIGPDACDCAPDYYGALCDVYCDAAVTCSGNGSCIQSGACSEVVLCSTRTLLSACMCYFSGWLVTQALTPSRPFSLPVNRSQYLLNIPTHTSTPRYHTQAPQPGIAPALLATPAQHAQSLPVGHVSCRPRYALGRTSARAIRTTMGVCVRYFARRVRAG
jgi:hypothetical protein